MKKFYVARDSDGELNLYEGKPRRGGNRWITARKDAIDPYIDCDRLFTLSESDFPGLTWENEPLEVMLVPCSSTVPILNMEKSKEECGKYMRNPILSMDEDMDVEIVKTVEENYYDMLEDQSSKKKELKIWIARDKPQLDEGDNEDKLGELHLFCDADTPILQFDQEKRIMRWRCAREIASIPSYMYPEIKNGQCEIISKV